MIATPTSIRPRAVALAILSLCCLCAGAAAADPRIPAPTAPTVAVHADQEVTTELAPLPGGVQEVELVLVLEDGRRHVRVSPETHALGGRVTWRVPRIRATSARLVLRAGGDAGEWESAPSAEFRIAAETTDAAQLRTAAIAGQLDEEGPLARVESRPAGLRESRAATSLAVAHALSEAVEASTFAGIAAPRPAVSAPCFGESRARAVRPLACRRWDTSPGAVPLRI